MPKDNQIIDLTADKKAAQGAKIPGGLANLKQDVKAVSDPALKSILKRFLKLISNEDA